MDFAPAPEASAGPAIQCVDSADKGSVTARIETASRDTISKVESIGHVGDAVTFTTYKGTIIGDHETPTCIGVLQGP
jgi:hypothetical protein